MALAVTFFAPANYFALADATVTASWAAGDEVFVFGFTGINADTQNTPTATGLTFSLVTSYVNTGAEATIYLWRATAGSSGSSVTITSTRNHTNPAAIAAYAVSEVGSVSTLTGNGSESPYASVATPAGGAVLFGACGFSADVPATTPLTGSGTATERADTGDVTNYGVYIVDWLGTAEGSFTFGPTDYTNFGAVSQCGVVLTPIQVLGATATGSGTAHDATVHTYGTSTVSLGAVGTWAYSTGNPAPSYPSGVSRLSELYIVTYNKPSTANAATTPTASGWTVVGTINGVTDGDTGGYTTTLGADTGNMNLWVMKKDTVTGTESGTVTVTHGGSNHAGAAIIRYERSSPMRTVDAMATGKDTSAGNVSIVTGSIDIRATEALRGVDQILAGMVIPTDVTTPSQFSAEALAQTGTTFGTVTEQVEMDSTSGNDSGGFLVTAPVSSGSGTGAVTLTATAGGTTTNVRGPGFVLRVRAGEGALAPPIHGSGSAHDATVNTGAGGTSANATVASATGSASGATTSIAPTSGSSAGSGTAQTAQASIKPTSIVSSATGTSTTATTSIAAGTGSAGGTGSSSSPGGSVSTSAGVAQATGTANDATPTRAGNPLAGAASGTGSANSSTTLVNPGSGSSSGSGSANGGQGSIAPTAVVSSASGSASNATISTAAATSASASEASASGTGQSATIKIATGAGSASSAGTANFDPTGGSISLELTAESAISATGTAHNATVSTATQTNASAGNASGSGSGNGATLLINPGSGVSSGSGSANGGQSSVAPTATVASATGAANNATVSTSGASGANAQVAPGSGTANDTATSIAPVVVVASAASPAHDATVSTATQTNASAAVASGSGTAADARTSIAPTSALSSASGSAASATGAVAPTSLVSSASSTASDTTAKISTGSGVSSGTGTSSGPGGSALVGAGSISASGSAHNPTVSTANATQANAVVASASGTSFATAAIRVAPVISTSTATATAHNAVGQPSITAGALVASASGSALTATARVSSSPASSTATATAHEADAQTGGTVTAGVAAASATAHNAVSSALSNFTNPRVGGWASLVQILRDAEQEMRSESKPLTECPNDGTPLQRSVHGELFCPFDGFTPHMRHQATHAHRGGSWRQDYSDDDGFGWS